MSKVDYTSQIAPVVTQAVIEHLRDADFFTRFVARMRRDCDALATAGGPDTDVTLRQRAIHAAAVKGVHDAAKEFADHVTREVMGVSHEDDA